MPDSVLATGSPADLKARAPAATVEDAFIALLPEELRAGHHTLEIPPRRFADAEPVIIARDLTCRFGDFTAVDRVNFTIERGEIFGFVGSNGCGKTTTMKMLTGLLPPSEGEALLFGKPLDARDIARAQSRRLHVAIVFALYRTDGAAEPRTARAAVPHAGARKRNRGLHESGQRNSGLPTISTSAPRTCRSASASGCRSRSPSCMSRKCSSSTSRPRASIRLARDRFWELLIDLSRNQGVTIFVSTHFMNEAERCDRISLMDSGRVLATDTPADLVKATRRRNAGGCLHRLSRRGHRRARAADHRSGAFRRTPCYATGAATAAGRQRSVQPAAPVRLYDSRNDRAPARPDPARCSPCSARPS